MGKKIIFFLVLALLFITKLTAQNAEIGFFGGLSYYVGELNPANPFVNKINPAIGVLYRRNLGKRYALRVGFNYGLLGSDDTKNSSEWFSFRNSSFSTSIMEASSILEFNFLPYQINNYTTSPFTPFIFVGAAMFRVSPEVSYNNSNTTVAARSIIAPSIPFGVGFKFNFIQNLGLNVEWGIRKTFTDEIDGLPPTYKNLYQESNSKNNDWYSFAGISVNYKILTKTDRCPVVK